ncbi:MAG TPA: polysaccharide biosynthesis/export family protein, partial [Fimbriimonadaceae bacterium]|nr:polysaccharide biosynthesis/export family protein [Fimbriimonadaceae bacterium]
MRKDHYVSAPFPWRGHALWVTAAFLLALPVAVRADYLLRPGDVLGMEVYGVPELTHQSKLDPDGTVTLPLIGRLRVADLTVDEVHGMIFEALSSSGLPTVGGEGRDLERPIGFAEILVEVAEFGPVYVSGQIAVPGQVPYVPNMTVRQLLASAGGLGSAESNL